MKRVVVAFVLALGAVVSVPGAVSAQTGVSAEDIAVRDQLIADQENLLNTYRCLFGVDVDVVPGGCPDPDEVSPGIAPENPNQQDIDVRDELIADQESLLNTYRCRFDVDTQIVPGGCVGGEPSLPGPVDPARPSGTAFTAISVGSQATCGIRADGAVECWGPNLFGETDAPEGHFTAISAGILHSCGIRTNGVSVCWGDDRQGQADAPGGQFTAISAGQSHTCGVTDSGAAVCWGYNQHGQADAPGGAVHCHLGRRNRHLPLFVCDQDRQHRHLLG